MKKKIAIQTLKLYDNYGGILQAYALQNYLEKLGFETTHLNRYNVPDKLLCIKLLLHKIIHYRFYKILKKNNLIFSNFIKQHINLSPALHTKNQWQNYIYEKEFAVVIVGSDQVWRFEYIAHQLSEFFLDYDKSEIKKMSYAASFGVENVDYENLKKVQHLLKKFSAISVRELQAVETLDKLQSKSLHHVDPTLLLNKMDYVKNFKLKKKSDSGKIFCYVLDKNSFKQEIISLVSDNLKLPYFIVYGDTPNLSNYLDVDFLNKPSINQWLQNFVDADYVVTDSFHGMVFSVIFNKPFLVIGNEERGLSRFTSFLKIVNLEERLILTNKNWDNLLIRKEINYDAVNKIVASEKEKSFSYFKNYI
jgi:hypothetical protein